MESNALRKSDPKSSPNGRNLAALGVVAGRTLVSFLCSEQIVLLYACGSNTLNQQLCTQWVSCLDVMVNKRSGKWPSFVGRFAPQLSSLCVSFGEYADLYRLDQIDITSLSSSLTSLSVCCSNAMDLFEDLEDFIQIRIEHGLESGRPIPKSAYRSLLPNLTSLQVYTTAASKSLVKRVPQSALPTSHLVVLYTSFPLIGDSLTKLKLGQWEQAFLGLLPDCLEDFELENGLVVKSFSAFALLPRSLISLRGLVVLDHSLGWEVDLPVIFSTVVRRSGERPFESKFRQLESTTSTFYSVRTTPSALYS